jgi:hypothetical protein
MEVRRADTFGQLKKKLRTAYAVVTLSSHT